MNTNEMMDVLRAIEDGKQVEWRRIGHNHDWEIHPGERCDFKRYEYRVRRNPRIWHLDRGKSPDYLALRTPLHYEIQNDDPALYELVVELTPEVRRALESRGLM